MSKKIYNIELSAETRDHVPIKVYAEGNGFKEVLDDAQYCIDVPDPKKYYPIGDLSLKIYDAITTRIIEEMASIDEMRFENAR